MFYNIRDFPYVNNILFRYKYRYDYFQSCRFYFVSDATTEFICVRI